MSLPNREDPRQIWDRRFAGMLNQGEPRLPYEPWLERWQHLLKPGGHLLDLGCGAGYDAHWLSRAGYAVAAGDFSFAALMAAREAPDSAAYLQLDLRQGLPFAPAGLDGIVANLCLHYFPWAQTVAILGQVRACLKPGGALLARFNSTRDANFGAEGCPPVEPNAFLVKGMYKRYFDRASLDELFAAGWHVLGLEELTIHRYGAPKVLWEVAAVKPG